MADYCLVSDLQSYLASSTPGLTFGSDELMVAGLAITAASTAIDRATNRSFQPQDTNATSRSFTPRKMPDPDVPFLLPNMLNYFYFLPFFTNYVIPDRVLPIDDLFLTNQLITDIACTSHADGTVLAVDRLWPLNAAAKGRPYTAIMFLPQTNIPDGLGSIDVQAKYGWPSVPSTIKNACLLQASRYFKRKDAPFGVAGNDAQGNVMRLWAQLDPDVEMMLGDFRNWWAVA